MRVRKYTGNKTYMSPSGAIMSPDVVMQQYPSITLFAHIVQTDDAGEVMFALQNLSAMRTQYGIAPELTEAEAIAAIEDAINTPAVVVELPTPEERIAAALEYQNLVSMEDI